jgi:hypothetical protein
MLKETLVSIAPFAFPAGCFSAGCSCEWMCSLLGAPGCVAAAGVAAAVIFSMLALANTLRGLGAIRD